MTDIKCGVCGLLFGRQEDSETLHIKHRDLYRTIRGGTVTGRCRRCGAEVRWPEEDRKSA